MKVQVVEEEDETAKSLLLVIIMLWRWVSAISIPFSKNISTSSFSFFFFFLIIGIVQKGGLLVEMEKMGLVRRRSLWGSMGWGGSCVLPWMRAS